MSAHPPLSTSGAGRVNAALKRELDRICSRSYAEAVWPDPLAIVHEYTDAADLEVMGLVASALAYGRVEGIIASLRRLQPVLGLHPAGAVRRLGAEGLLSALAGFRHRFTSGEDVTALLLIADGMREASGSIGAFFAEGYVPGDMKASLADFVRRAMELPVGPCYGGTIPREGGVRYLLPSPERGSACKRLNLYLRWMVRGPDGRDLGLWRGIVDTADLVIPLDTHIGRICRALGLTSRRVADWKTAVEITQGLARFDPADPVRYDFPLARLGILGRCPTRPDEAACRGCGLGPFCAVKAGDRTPRPA